jgi:hypothetical protein
MQHRTIALVFGLSASLLAMQGALGSQDPALGYDPFHQFGYDRPAHLPTGTGDLFRSGALLLPGYEIDYVYGSDARAIAAGGTTRTAMQLRDALGEQAGA